MNRKEEKRWAAAVEAERRGVCAVFSVLATVEDKIGLLRRAVTSVSERDTALRALLLSDDGTKKALFPELVDLCSVGHRDIDLCRMVMKSLPRAWVLKHVGALVDEQLPFVATAPSKSLIHLRASAPVARPFDLRKNVSRTR